MTHTDFLSELEADFEWRFAEVTTLKGAVGLASPGDRDTLRKSLILVLYSHLEGFCVFALRHYVEAVNQAGVPCGDATPAILAGAWEQLFNAVFHGDQKCDLFSRRFPNDEGLHSHWRRRHFVEEIRGFEAGAVRLDEDVIDAGSNLKPLVLQRNLFILGLDHSFVGPHASTLSRLLGRRNSIAHGTERRGVPELEYEEYERIARTICRDLTDLLETSHRNRVYRKTPLPAS
jgi:hypothetical protein